MGFARICRATGSGQVIADVGKKYSHATVRVV